jgi:undecaprenyl-diphosphatase
LPPLLDLHFALDDMRFLPRFLFVGFHFVRAALYWIGNHDLSVLLSILIVLLSVVGFGILADEVGDGATQRFDEWAVRAMRTPEDPAIPIGPPWLVEVGRDVTALGGVAVLTLLTIAVVGFFWICRIYASMWLVILTTLGGVAVSIVLKNLMDRPRPEIVPHLSIVHSTSFPSGHSMLSAIVYLTLGTLLAEAVQSKLLRAYFLIVAAVLTALVGVSRVYLGVHYPTDVLAGWTAGVGWAVACGFVARIVNRRRLKTTVTTPGDKTTQPE